jgi:hypothetical protein
MEINCASTTYVAKAGLQFFCQQKLFLLRFDSDGRYQKQQPEIDGKGPTSQTHCKNFF